MKGRRYLVRVVLAGVFLGSSSPLACADSDPAADPAADGGVDSTSGDAADAGDTDAHREAGVCSASRLCTIAVPIDTRINLTSVCGSGPADVWAVGTSGSILHYSGTVWEKAELASTDASSNFTLQSVWLERSDDVWILEGNRIRHTTGWNGAATEWSFSGRPVSEELIPTAVHGAGALVWVVRGGKLAKGGGTSLTKFDGWADGGPVGVRDFDLSANPTRLSAVVVSQPGEAWAVGENNVLRARLVTEAGADAWQIEEHNSRTTKFLHGVWGDHETVWLVGEGGVLRRRTAATSLDRSFEIVPGPVTTDLYGVFGFGAADVWAVGEASTVLHWNGQEWSRLSTPFDDATDKPRLLAVWGSSPRDVWIAGHGVMLHLQEEAP